MSLAPKFKGHRLAFAPVDASGVTQNTPLHTVDVYLDYVCPFSAKIFKTLYHTVFPALRAGKIPGAKVQFILRPQIQPWHPSSTLVHEAAVAVQRLTASDPAKFWAFSDALFAAQKEYFDVSVVDEPRNATYKRLAKLAAESTGGAASEGAVYDLLKIPSEPGKDGALNVGNAVTDDLKVHIKVARLVGVHVSPTVIVNGVVAGDISSSWTADQWLEYLGKNAV